MLRVIDCRISIPFWNWALYSDTVWSTTPTYHMWKAVGGFGGNGTLEEGYCVTNGTFKFDKWKIYFPKTNKLIFALCNRSKGCIRQALLNPFYHTCLRRLFRCGTPQYMDVYMTIKNLTLTNFHLFNIRVIKYWHNVVHRCLSRFQHLFVRE